MRVGVRVNQLELLDPVADCIPFRARRSRSPKVDYLYSVLGGKSDPDSRIRHYHLLYLNSRRLARTFELPELMATLRYEIPEVIAHGAKRRLMLQGGAVVFDGKAVLLPGRSPDIAALVAALVRAGGEFYSDRFAQLDVNARLHPDPFRPVEALGRTADSFPRENSRKAAARPGVPVGLIAFMEHEHRHDGVRPLPNLTPGRTLLSLLEYAPASWMKPRECMEILHKLATDVTAVRGHCGEAPLLVESLLSRLTK